MLFDNEITIVFSSNITSFHDWFPLICVNDSSEYANEYLFDGGHQWSIYNLIVENYVASDYYYLMRSKREYAEIECIGCTFSNITTYDAEYLFESYGSLKFADSQFRDINSSLSPLMRTTANYYFFGDILELATITEEVSIINCSFINITNSHSMLYLDYITDEEAVK